MILIIFLGFVSKARAFGRTTLLWSTGSINSNIAWSPEILNVRKLDLLDFFRLEPRLDLALDARHKHCRCADLVTLGSDLDVWPIEGLVLDAVLEILGCCHVLGPPLVSEIVEKPVGEVLALSLVCSAEADNGLDVTLGELGQCALGVTL